MIRIGSCLEILPTLPEQSDFKSFLREFQASRWGHFERCCEDEASNVDESRLSQRQSKSRDDGPELSPFVGTGWWATEPDVVRVVPGFRGRVDRIRGLGNAVVPVVAEYIGRRILDDS